MASLSSDTLTDFNLKYLLIFYRNCMKKWAYFIGKFSLLSYIIKILSIPAHIAHSDTFCRKREDNR